MSRAGELLEGLQARAADVSPSRLSVPSAPAPRQGLLFAPQEVMAQELLRLDLNRTTPLDALKLLARWQEELAELGGA